MLIDHLGLPKETGASDLQDSARLAGVMTVFTYPIVVPLQKYVIDDNYITKYCRHPLEYKYDFSRDQAICLMAGLYFQSFTDSVDRRFVDGRDWFFPSHQGHVKRCQGKTANWFEDLWLKADIVFNAKFTPLAEPNQLLCMMAVAGASYVNLWTRLNPRWREAIKNYWCENDGAWRGEPELAENIIDWVLRNGGSNG